MNGETYDITLSCKTAVGEKIEAYTNFYARLSAYLEQNGLLLRAIALDENYPCERMIKNYVVEDSGVSLDELTVEGCSRYASTPVELGIHLVSKSEQHLNALINALDLRAFEHFRKR